MKNAIPAMLVAVLATLPVAARAQQRALDVSGRDSVTLVAGPEYADGGLHRFLFGGTYRDLWVTPIRVPVLNLKTFDGGLKPLKQGGGFETKSLRLITRDGVEYAFRSVDKGHGPLPDVINDVPLANAIAADQVSSAHPVAPVIVSVLLDAAGVLQGSPVLVAMPDDPILGKYRHEFARRLGTLERFPSVPKGDAPAFANALQIIGSDTLLQLLDRDHAEQVDGAAFLAARLMDMLVNNWDRHPGQWKWARLSPDRHARWEPVSRDFDKAFSSTGGFFPGMLRQAVPNLVTFDSSYSSMHALTWNSLELDRRLLTPLSKPVWDSVANELMRRITDAVIDRAVAAMPPEYRYSAPPLAAKLRFRRDSLAVEAARFYRYLAGVVDIHATDADDRAIVTRANNEIVDVRLESAEGKAYFYRQFDAKETSSIRIYLHGGDDYARIDGRVDASIPVHIIGGNGSNTLIDSSTVAGQRHTADLYDRGTVSGVLYTPDTLFNRRPLIHLFGRDIVPGRDYGTGSSPIVDLIINREMGIEPRLGLTHYSYGFRDYPYSTMMSLEGRYSFRVNGFMTAFTVDKRIESSETHWTLLARMSDVDLVNYHGLGNASPETPGYIAGIAAPRTDYYAVNERLWQLHPALARALSETTDLSIGPVLQYGVTDSLADRFVSATRPYGFGNFGEAGLRLALLHVDREPKHHPHTGSTLDLSATWYPAVWDVRSPFAVFNAAGALFITIPAPLHPFLALRGGAKKVTGDFPFEESAFLGGRNDVRTFDLQRFAGDASVYATAELRIPVARFQFLLPLNTGLLATEDVGRVYVNGESPGGWHNALGAGFWIGFHDLTADVRIMHANEIGVSPALALRFGLPGVFR